MTRRAFPVIAFRDLAIGDEFESLGRTVTESDIVAFAGLSGDYTPIHVDHEHAGLGPFGGPVAHGLLGLAIASGLGSMAPRADTLAFLGFSDWQFLKPIRPGDTLRVITVVAQLEPQARERRGLVTWRRRIENQRGEVVQEGMYRTLVNNPIPPDGETKPGPGHRE